MRNRIDLTTPANVQQYLRTPSNATLSSVETAQIQNMITAASRYWLRLCGYGPINQQQATQSPFNEAVSFDEFYDGDGQTRLYTRNRPISAVAALIINGITIALSTAWNVTGYVIDQSGESLQLRGSLAVPPRGWSFGQFGPSGPSGQTANSAFRFPPGVSNIELQYTAGFASIVVTNELQTIPASPGPYTLTTLNPALANTRIRYFSGGATLTPVATAPSAGQYVILDIGIYQFAAADAGAQVLIDYTQAGTPEDVQLAVAQMVATNYKRRGTIDQKMQTGGATFRDWELPPEVVSVLYRYKRRALV
jgi:hypothetical protein